MVKKLTANLNHSALKIQEWQSVNVMHQVQVLLPNSDIAISTTTEQEMEENQTQPPM